MLREIVKNTIYIKREKRKNLCYMFALKTKFHIPVNVYGLWVLITIPSTHCVVYSRAFIIMILLFTMKQEIKAFNSHHRPQPLNFTNDNNNQNH